MTYNYIQTAIEGHIFTLILNREEKRNAFTPTMVNEVAHALHEANENEQIHVLLLKANGPVFCAGMDLKTFQDRSLDVPNPNIENKDISLGEVFDQFNKPSIALIEGDVIAGGFLYLLGCTYVFAKDGLNFRLPEVALGIFPFQVMAGLRRIMPEKKVLQLCLNPEPFTTNKALDLGIVDAILDYQQVDKLLNSFTNTNSFAMKAGFEALKNIRNMEASEQYNYLLAALEELKSRPEVKNAMAEKLKKD